MTGDDDEARLGCRPPVYRRLVPGTQPEITRGGVRRDAKESLGVAPAVSHQETPYAAMAITVRRPLMAVHQQQGTARRAVGAHGQAQPFVNVHTGQEGTQMPPDRSLRGPLVVVVPVDANVAIAGVKLAFQLERVGIGLDDSPGCGLPQLLHVTQQDQRVPLFQIVAERRVVRPFTLPKVVRAVPLAPMLIGKDDVAIRGSVEGQLLGPVEGAVQSTEDLLCVAHRPRPGVPAVEYLIWPGRAGSQKAPPEHRRSLRLACHSTVRR